MQGLIGFFTNLFYFQKLSFAFSLAPADNTLGWLAVLVPVLGGLVIGLLARYGSERIRGHGIPEAIEAILIGQSRMQPKVAVLKPLSSAISIGSGGPFGAEGPIIMTGGASARSIAQFFHLTAAERKTLLVAGAAGGMAATFGTPVAAVLLAVELLLFELKPRSLIPVALASARRPSCSARTLWSRRRSSRCSHAGLHRAGFSFSSGLVGLLSGVLGPGADVGGLCHGGSVSPSADSLDVVASHRRPGRRHRRRLPTARLGVGYDIIRELMQRAEFPVYALGRLLALMAVKAFIWSAALGSGTSGGVLAPLLDHGRRPGGAGIVVSAGRRSAAVGAGRHGRRSWAARCARL